MILFSIAVASCGAGRARLARTVLDYGQTLIDA